MIKKAFKSKAFKKVAKGEIPYLWLLRNSLQQIKNNGLGDKELYFRSNSVPDEVVKLGGRNKFNGTVSAALERLNSIFFASSNITVPKL